MIEIKPIQPWEIGNGTGRLSDRGKLLVAKAQVRMDDEIPLSVEATPFLEGGEDGNGCARHETDNGVVWCEIKVYTAHAGSYQRDGFGDTDYVLAHELGHAVRIANKAEPREIEELYWHVENTPDLQEKARKNEHFKSRPIHVCEMIVEDEKAAWAIAEELMDGVDHVPERLSKLRQNSIRGYEKGLLGE